MSVTRQGDSLNQYSLPSIVNDNNVARRSERLREIVFEVGCCEFVKRRDGMIYAMNGGLWLHRHIWLERPLVHLVSVNKARLVHFGIQVGLDIDRLQYKPLKDPRTGIRKEAWHWDLGGPVYPPYDERLFRVLLP